MRTLVALSLSLCACGGVKYSASTTKGEGCADLAEAFCSRLIECAAVPSRDRGVCLEGFQGGCCADGRTCGDRIANPSGAADCVNQLPTSDCAQYRSRIALPAYCQQMF